MTRPRAPRNPRRHDPQLAGQWYLGGLWVRDFTDPTRPFLGAAEQLVQELRDYHYRHATQVLIHAVDGHTVSLRYLPDGRCHHYRRTP